MRESYTRVNKRQVSYLFEMAFELGLIPFLEFIFFKFEITI